MPIKIAILYFGVVRVIRVNAKRGEVGNISVRAVIQQGPYSELNPELLQPFGSSRVRSRLIYR